MESSLCPGRVRLHAWFLKMEAGWHVTTMQTSFTYDCTPLFVQMCALKSSRSSGKERDIESGNDYFGARYYSSSTGRFMSPDPSGLAYADPFNPQSFNLYSYARNNPLTNVDPSGMELTCSPRFAHTQV
jgi:RHS repeat-associated protein